MHGLLANLPAPVQQHVPVVAPERPSFTPKLSKQAPPYGTKERQNYVPRRLDDYADGGAFPEVRSSRSSRAALLRLLQRITVKVLCRLRAISHRCPGAFSAQHIACFVTLS